MRGTLWAFAGWIAAAATAYGAGDPPVELVPESVVYRAGAPGPVKLQLRNSGTKTVIVSGWHVRKGTATVYSAQGSGGVLAPGQSLTISWDKRRSNGSWAPAGSYRILAQVRVGAESPRYCHVTVALSSTGKLAGTSLYPLAVGNWWRYRRSDGTEWVSQVTASGSGWYFMTKPPAGTGWVILAGAARPILWVWDGSKAQPLFRFTEPAGTTWNTDLQGRKTLRLHSADEPVLTPLAKFNTSLVIRTEPYTEAWWFVRGLGAVRGLYYIAWILGDSKLVGAKIRGSDGGWYTLRSTTMTSDPAVSPDP